MAVNPPSTAASHQPLRVLVIDAHPAVRRGLARLIGIMPGLQICGLPARCEEGLAAATLARPDVVLVDAELPGDATRVTIGRLRVCLPTARVVALGLYADRRAGALAAGAHAFVLKDAGFEALRAAIVAGRTAEPPAEVTGESASARTPGSIRPCV